MLLELLLVVVLLLLLEAFVELRDEGAVGLLGEKELLIFDCVSGAFANTYCTSFKCSWYSSKESPKKEHLLQALLLWTLRTCVAKRSDLAAL